MGKKTKIFDGKIDGKPVKVIIKNKGYRNEWFAKPKNFDVDTPHFLKNVGGTLEVHQDSADGNSYRVLAVNDIYSGSISSGSTFASNKDMDMVVLPMNKSADGFAIDTRYSGSLIEVLNEEEWILMGLGNFGPWLPKK